MTSGRINLDSSSIVLEVRSLISTCKPNACMKELGSTCNNLKTVLGVIDAIYVYVCGLIRSK